ncbi:hypothetical protein QWY90_07230 [Flavobacterium paronense]|uniref:GLPGLI family protein n=1 Tax=Flavobacterium paronense TaxID=1392775 RepID=A0ABV5GGF5_9FLAO|nr:hypothetical protein [Flavobacterium paronense]MDN3677102.1 hypothetical protein [Flavobacterium paronense]
MKQKTINNITLLALLICSFCTAQKSDFIVTTANDTLYVDKITVSDFEIKTKFFDEKKKYKVDDIISYYIAKKKEHYVRIPVEKKEVKTPDRYDYKRNENLYLEKYEVVKQYKYIQRLTEGKVKLFCEVIKNSPPVGNGLGNGFGNGVGNGFGNGNGAGFYTAENSTYYIGIYDSKLEVIKDKKFFKFFDFSKGIELNESVYEILKTYLYGNNEISFKLDTLFVTKPIAKEKQIIDLINEYNVWAKSNK